MKHKMDDLLSGLDVNTRHQVESVVNMAGEGAKVEREGSSVAVWVEERRRLVDYKHRGTLSIAEDCPNITILIYDNPKIELRHGQSTPYGSYTVNIIEVDGVRYRGSQVYSGMYKQECCVFLPHENASGPGVKLAGITSCTKWKIDYGTVTMEGYEYEEIIFTKM